jgi:hypothetical protein
MARSVAAQPPNLKPLGIEAELLPEREFRFL